MEQLQKQIDSLKMELNALKSADTLPYDIEQALRIRLRVIDYAQLSPSAKSAGSEDEIVNESGSSTHAVLGTPAGFEERVVGGVTHYYPFYT
jgi:hypothetical protein